MSDEQQIRDEIASFQPPAEPKKAPQSMLEFFSSPVDGKSVTAQTLDEAATYAKQTHGVTGGRSPSDMFEEAYSIFLKWRDALVPHGQINPVSIPEPLKEALNSFAIPFIGLAAMVGRVEGQAIELGTKGKTNESGHRFSDIESLESVAQDRFVRVLTAIHGKAHILYLQRIAGTLSTEHFDHEMIERVRNDAAAGLICIGAGVLLAARALAVLMKTGNMKNAADLVKTHAEASHDAYMKVLRAYRAQGSTMGDGESARHFREFYGHSHEETTRTSDADYRKAVEEFRSRPVGEEFNLDDALKTHTPAPEGHPMHGATREEKGHG